jgi:hypothetical protein
MEIHQFQPYKQPASLSFTFCYMTTSNTRKRQIGAGFNDPQKNQK